MAKKKTAEKAKIEAVPVLRDGGGDDPVITKSYIMRDDWIDKDITNYVAFKSIDGEVETVFVNGEPAGGGGAELVKVTIVNNTSDELEVSAVHLIEANPLFPAHLDFYVYPEANSSVEIYTVAAGDYNKIFVISGADEVAVTGDLTIDAGWPGPMVTVHGAGTVTFSNSEVD